jgi:hypothetical protein
MERASGDYFHGAIFFGRKKPEKGERLRTCGSDYGHCGTFYLSARGDYLRVAESVMADGSARTPNNILTSD